MEKLEVRFKDKRFICEYNLTSVMSITPTDIDIVNNDASLRNDIERRLIESIQDKIMKDVCLYLSNHSQKADIPYYGDETKINVTTNCPENEVLVLMHPKRMTELLIKGGVL